MRELEGRTYAEIAEVLELSTSAVETLLFRARRALREQLEGTLTCGEAERALSLQLDGRLPSRTSARAFVRICASARSARRSRGASVPAAPRCAASGRFPLPGFAGVVGRWSGSRRRRCCQGRRADRRRDRRGRHDAPGRRGDHRSAEARTRAARRRPIRVGACGGPSRPRAVQVAPAEARARRASVTNESARRPHDPPPRRPSRRPQLQPPEGAAAAPGPETAAEPQSAAAPSGARGSACASRTCLR